MWKPAVATAALLVVLVFAQLDGPGPQPETSRNAGPAVVATPPAERGCAKAVLQDLIQDDRIDGSYAKRCYEALLEMVPADGYSVGTIRNPVEEKLRDLEAKLSAGG